MPASQYKKKYYFSYIKELKSGGLGKKRYSKEYSSLHKAMKDARQRQKQGKILQADFIRKKSPVSHKHVSTLGLSGRIKKA